MSRLGQELIQGIKEAIAYVEGQEHLENYRICPKNEKDDLSAEECAVVEKGLGHG